MRRERDIKNKHIFKQISEYLICFIVILISISFIQNNSTFNIVEAHSGRTDSSGGHHDNKNKSGLGGYHYHCGGNPAHLHTNGTCPYSSDSNAISEQLVLDTITISEYPQSLNVGEKNLVSYNIESTENSYATMTSSDENVISIDNNTLNAKNVGTAIITIKSQNNSKSFMVSVSPVLAESLTFTSENEKIQLGESESILIEILPDNTTDKTISWSSSDESVAIYSDGEIKTMGVGNAIITGTTANSVSKSIDIEVYEVFPNEIKVSNKKMDIEINNTELISFTILPENSNKKDYTVQLSDEGIVNLTNKDNEYSINTVSEGSTSIIVTTWNGITKTIPINVYHIPVEKILLNTPEVKHIFKNYYIYENSNLNIPVTIYPDNATYQNYEWNSGNEEVVVVEDKELKIVGEGNVVLVVNGMDNTSGSISLNMISIDTARFIIIISIIIAIVLCCFIVVGRKYLSKKMEDKTTL